MSSPTGSNTGYNYHVDLLNSWTKENSTSATPRFQFNDNYTGSMSTRFLTKGSYLNIENINIGYTFPSRWMKAVNIQSLRVFAACENVVYWSKRQGFDPRQSYSSATNATNYSPMRTSSLGISLKF